MGDIKDIEEIVGAASLGTDASEDRGRVEAGLAAAWLACVVLGSFIWAFGFLALAFEAMLVLVAAVVVAAAGTSYLTMAWAAIWAFGGWAWLDLLAVITPIAYVGTVGVVAALAVSWWTCFRPFRREWPRWIPLTDVLVGVWLVSRNLAWTETHIVEWFQPMALAHVLACVLALAWAVSLGLASPRRFGLST